MNTPWIEVYSYDEPQAYGSEFSEEYPWNASFACQVCIRPFESLQKLKWGFNSAVLYEEALDRQKLFLESQYAINQQYRIELPTRRTLALRCINIPGKGLQVGLIGKITAKSPSEAKNEAAIYWREIHSMLPYDHNVFPAISQDDYRQVSGTHILQYNSGMNSIVQIKRYETPLPGSQTQMPILGTWQTLPHSDEQIWRALAALPYPAMLNISLRPTVLYDQERLFLLKLRQRLSQMENEQGNSGNNGIHKGWIEPFINRRLSPWGKFFYLQIHIATESEEVDESLARAIGTSITRITGDKTSPGYETTNPMDDEEARSWKKRLIELEIIRSSSEYAIPRLHEIADLEEAWSVFRFPYPPEGGWPGLVILDPTKDEYSQ